MAKKQQQPDEDPFEIARRLDEFGAARTPRREKPPEPSRKTAPQYVKKRASPKGLILLVMAILAMVGWVIYQRQKPMPIQPISRSNSETLQASPPQMIPAIDGKGEVPAFTVQVPNATPSPKPSPSAR